MAVDRPTPITEDEYPDPDMDVDERASEFGQDRALRTDTIFAKSEEMEVTFYAQLPEEVKGVLKSAGLFYNRHQFVISSTVLADFFHDAYTGQVDTVTGFALIASSERCFVWNYSQVRHYKVTTRKWNIYESCLRLSLGHPLATSSRAPKMLSRYPWIRLFMVLYRMVLPENPASSLPPLKEEYIAGTRWVWASLAGSAHSRHSLNSFKMRK
jgi:hypothetical protein